MNYKHAKNILSRHNVILVIAPVSRLTISLTGEPTIAMVRPDKIAHDTKRAAIELMEYLNKKNAPAPTTAHGAKQIYNLKIPRNPEKVN